jgi:hypothetical protein
LHMLTEGGTFFWHQFDELIQEVGLE